MKPIRMLGALLLAIVAVGALTAGVAAAENPQILPVPTEKVPLTFKIEPVAASEPVLEGTDTANKFKCKELKGEGLFTSARLGSATLNFTGGCVVAKEAKCKAEGDAAGTILIKRADIHLVGYKTGTELLLGIAVLPLKAAGGQPFIIECGVLTIELSGTFIGAISAKDLVKTKNVEVTFSETAGEQTLKTCELDKAFCEGKTFKLETNFGKAFELTGEAVTSKMVTEKEVEFHF